MNHLLTLELNQGNEMIEMHLNKRGADFLRVELNKLIDGNIDKDIHLMTQEWGGNELSEEKQNLSQIVKLLHHLKIIYSIT